MVKAATTSTLLALIQVIVALLVVVAMSGIARSIGGEGLAERTNPFANAHLLEDAVEGTFRPLADPTFMVTALATALLAFGATTAIALKVRFVAWSSAVCSVAIAIVALALLRHWVFSAGHPPPMRWAYVFLLSLCAVAGIGVASYNRIRHAS